MAGGTTIILVSAIGDRGIYDTYTSSNSPTTNNSDSATMQFGTSVSDSWDAIYEIDLTGIPKGIVITIATLTLNVLVDAGSGSAAELAVEVVRLPFGLPYDIAALTFNNYDGVNPWPNEQFDRGITVNDAMPTSTGLWNIELKTLINDCLRLGENILYFAIRRVKRTTPHKFVIVDGSTAIDNTNRPKLTITHSPAIAPETVIVGNRLQSINPTKSLPRPHFREGQYDLKGDPLFLSEDGGEKIIAGSNIMQLYADNDTQIKVMVGGIDGYGTKRLTNWRGLRNMFGFSWPSTNTGTTRQAYIPGGIAVVLPTAKWGVKMPRDGSIIGIDLTIDINIIGSGDTLEGQAWINGVASGLVALVDPITVANGIEAVRGEAAVGVYTFSKGDYLTGARVHTGSSPGQVTTDDWHIDIEVEFDA